MAGSDWSETLASALLPSSPAAFESGFETFRFVRLNIGVKQPRVADTFKYQHIL